MNKKEVLKHMDDLSKVFNLKLDNEQQKITFWKRLRHLEGKAHKFAEDCCNFLDLTEEEHSKKVNKILDLLDNKLNFRKQDIPVFWNGDPRGYALKIENNFTRKLRDKGIYLRNDWEGGIIAPNL